MRTVLVVSPTEVSPSSLQTVLQHFDPVQNPLGPSHGLVLQSGAVSVLVSQRALAEAGFGEEELRHLTDRLGAPPQSLVVVDIGHDEHSEVVGASVCAQLVAAFGGLPLND